MIHVSHNGYIRAKGQDKCQARLTTLNLSICFIYVFVNKVIPYTIGICKFLPITVRVNTNPTVKLDDIATFYSIISLSAPHTNVLRIKVIVKFREIFR